MSTDLGRHDDEPMMRLESNDGAVLSIHQRAAMQSEVLHSFFSGDMTDEDEDFMRLPNVTSAALHRIVEFLEEHTFGQAMDTIPQPIPWPLRIPDVVSPAFYAHFVMSLTRRELVELLLAADYLCIPPLMSLCAARLGRLMMNCTPEEALVVLQRGEEAEGEGQAQGRPVTIEMLSQAEREQLQSSLHWSVVGAAGGKGSHHSTRCSSAAAQSEEEEEEEEEDEEDLDAAEPPGLMRRMHEARAQDLLLRQKSAGWDGGVGAGAEVVPREGSVFKFAV